MPTDPISAVHNAALRTGFSGVIRIDRPGEDVFVEAYGFADRARRQRMTIAHRCGLASVSKGFTALAVGALIDDGVLSFESRARDMLGADLPLVHDDVTVGHLLAHTSGIGDYLDEAHGEITDYIFDRPLHLFASTEAFLPVLDGHPQVSTPGSGFTYCNSGFVVLALVAERASGVPFHELVSTRVFAPAGMADTGYPRADEIAGDMALGYLDERGDRTNVFHLPVRGSGDGGAFTTVADLALFWTALFAGKVVSDSTRDSLTSALNHVPSERMRYGRGFWRGWESDAVILEGYDAGVSARTWHDPSSGVTGSIIANTSEGAWPVIAALDWS